MEIFSSDLIGMNMKLFGIEVASFRVTGIYEIFQNIFYDKIFNVGLVFEFAKSFHSNPSEKIVCGSR